MLITAGFRYIQISELFFMCSINSVFIYWLYFHFVVIRLLVCISQPCLVFSVDTLPLFSVCHLALFTWDQTRGNYQRKTMASIQCTMLGSVARLTPDFSQAPIQISQLSNKESDTPGNSMGLTLTSGPRSSSKFSPAAQIGLFFPLKTPHPSAKLLLIYISPW